MSFEQIITLAVLAGVILALIQDRIRADIVALGGAAILLATGAVRPSEVQGAFGSPALITLASLFVIAHAMELSGLLDLLIRTMVKVCRRSGSFGSRPWPGRRLPSICRWTGRAARRWRRLEPGSALNWPRRGRRPGPTGAVRKD